MLPRLLAPVLPILYSPRYLLWRKAHGFHEHAEFPYHTFVHCKVFAPAAPRGARTSISVSFLGLPLSWPLLIIGLVGHYPTNYLISRQLIHKHYFLRIPHSRWYSSSGFTLSFPRLSQTCGQITDVLLSIVPVSLRIPELAWLSRTQLAAISRRINEYSLLLLILVKNDPLYDCC